MILRGVRITECNLSKAEKKPPVGSLNISFDMTQEIAEAMGWDCLYDTKGTVTSGWSSFPLKGDVAIVSAKFRPNSRKQKGEVGEAEITATAITTFRAHRVEGKGDEGVQFYLSGIVKSADESFETTMGPYWRGIADGVSQLTLVEAQKTLFNAEDQQLDDVRRKATSKEAD